MEKEVTIECRGIKKSYGKDEYRVDALRGIDLDIYKGDLTLLVGPSGCGKTTLISIITNILTPDSGELHILGHEFHDMTKVERAKFCCHNLGIVFQSLFLIPQLSVEENVSLPLLIAGIEPKEATDRAMASLKQMKLDHRSGVSPAFLSKGQQQRVAIARAIVNDSQILVCDEPTSSLDETAGLETMAILREIAVHSSRSVLVVTHDHRTFPYADRIVHMNDGQILDKEPHE